MGALPAFYASGQKELYQEASFETLGYMPDCSRNAVLNVEGAKLLIRLSCHGFNALMLYTEDTYEIEGYPYFGYMRGRFTKAELKELDAYALSLGVELIPCIQVLAFKSDIPLEHIQGHQRFRRYPQCRQARNL